MSPCYCNVPSQTGASLTTGDNYRVWWYSARRTQILFSAWNYLKSRRRLTHNGVALPLSHRAVLSMLAQAHNEDEDKGCGQQDDGGLNLRRVPNMAAGPDVETMLSRLGRTRNHRLGSRSALM
jgi:hypothetical protein